MSPTITSDKQLCHDTAVTPAVTGVSVVVPCFNEAESFPQLLERLDELLAQWNDAFPVEVILVDDGSDDETLSLMEAAVQQRAYLRIVRHAQNQGISAALLSGISAAWQEVVCTIDADCTYDPNQLNQMLPLLQPDVDAVTASPYHPQGKVENIPAWRLTLSRCASGMYSLIFRQKLHTYTSCFRVLRRQAVCQLQVLDPGFLGVTEILWRLDRQGSRIVEFPAVLTARRFGQSKLRVLKVATSHLRFFLRAGWERLTSR